MGQSVWYRFFKEKFVGREPGYFDVSNKDWCIDLELNYESISREILYFVRSHPQKLKDYRFHITDGQSQWQTFPLMSWGVIHRKNIRHLPKTWGVFSRIRGVSSVSISRLIAGTTIPSHHGDTNAIYRCHYGIQIPGKAPSCAFVVNNEMRSWANGKVLAFCDAHLHYALNETSSDRYVILFDVVREEFLLEYKKICSTILATHVLHAIDFYVQFYDKAGARLLRLLHTPLYLMASIFLTAQNLIYRSRT